MNYLNDMGLTRCSGRDWSVILLDVDNDNVVSDSTKCLFKQAAFYYIISMPATVIFYKYFGESQ